MSLQTLLLAALVVQAVTTGAALAFAFNVVKALLAAAAGERRSAVYERHSLLSRIQQPHVSPPPPAPSAATQVVAPDLAEDLAAYEAAGGVYEGDEQAFLKAVQDEV